MKVLVVLTYYAPHWTGLTAYAKRIAEGLAARGHQVTVLTSQHDRSLPKVEGIGGVRVERIPYLLRLSRGVVMPSFPRALRRLLRENDVVQVHTPILESQLITTLARRARRPVLLTHQGDLVMPAGAVNRVIERGVTWTMTQGQKQATALSVHSCDYADNSDYLRPFKYKLHCIYPPVDLPAPDKGQIARWRTELGLDGKKLVGYAGRFVEEKGFDFLYRAIPLVLEKQPEAKFVYAGEQHVGYEQFFERLKPLMDRNKEHLVYMGLLTDQQRLANFYAMCDVFCLPSRTDCFPSVQLEAITCGTPLVSADIPGAREVVQRTGMGLLVEPRNPRALADGLIKVLDAPAAYVKPPSEIEAVFNLERSISEYESLLQQLVDGSLAKGKAAAEASR